VVGRLAGPCCFDRPSTNFDRLSTNIEAITFRPGETNKLSPKRLPNSQQRYSLA
jgi:hypothetical protein